MILAYTDSDCIPQPGWIEQAIKFFDLMVFESVGFFDDSLLSGGDTHWGKKAQASGYSIGYAADTCVQHPARRTARELAVKLRRTMGGLFMIGQENQGRLTLAQLARVLTYWKARSVWKAIRTILRSRRLSSTQKLRVVALRLYLESVSFGETIRLHRGAGKR